MMWSRAFNLVIWSGRAGAQMSVKSTVLGRGERRAAQMRCQRQLLRMEQDLTAG